ncbi:helix-turn-helix domain-containing protein [Rhodopseudomonas infernalis]|uniref:helix-turn-helix domain-containing protein n=1 Tax=Rhodopseudomonas infernalis TaxID=2897386 RepID=UPI001EE8BF8E|nr:helix-turn-helix domain-containing protein [Rhodopseudomonas infernalis]
MQWNFQSVTPICEFSAMLFRSGNCIEVRFSSKIILNYVQSPRSPRCHRCLMVSLDDLARETSADPKLAWQLRNIVSDKLRSAHERLLLLGRKSASERVAAFLLEMDRRLVADGIMCLPMCEYDIADYLGLSNETVSRC